MKARLILVLLTATAAITAVAGASATGATAQTAASGTPQELPRNAFLLPAGRLTKLAAGTTYKASDFPLPLRVTPSDGSWGGAQWKADSSFQHKKSTVAPFYGWVSFEEKNGAGAYLGAAITIMTPYGPTRSVAATVAGLRTRGHGATYQSTSLVKLAGYPGVQFDGQVVGKEHVFIPFSPKSTVAKWYPDNYGMGQGEVFRIIVLGVRGKTVVVYLENLQLPADQFPAFLTRADTLLNTLKFPA